MKESFSRNYPKRIDIQEKRFPIILQNKHAFENVEYFNFIWNNASHISNK